MFEPSDDQLAAVEALRAALETEGTAMLNGPAGSGKALRDGSLVQTPSGPVRIETLKAGDHVFGVNGTPVRVTGVFPQGVRQGYRVTFRDGMSVLCDGDHLWSVRTTKLRKNNRPYRQMTTVEILDTGVKDNSGNMKYTIPLCNAVQYPKKDLPIDPYVLGAFIGDGTMWKGTPILCLGNRDMFIADEVSRRLPDWAVLTRHKPQGGSTRCAITYPQKFHANETAWRLQRLNLNVKSPERFIPAVYLHASVQQRWDLLRGLMDTDGASQGNRISFSTMSRSLAHDMCTLVQSLGGTAILRAQDRGDKGVEYDVNVKLFTNPFLLPAKAVNWKPSRKNPPSRYIANIEPIEKAEHTCISVDAEDGLFLTEHYVATHNTTLVGPGRLAERLGYERVRYVSLLGKAVDRMRERGILSARTIHSTFFMPVEKADKLGKLNELTDALGQETDRKKQRSLRAQIIALEGDIGFVAKEDPWAVWVPEERQYISEPPDLVVIDEASMVNELIGSVIHAAGVDVLAVGDLNQLPPIEGKPFYNQSSITYSLSTVHRTTEGSPVIGMAHEVLKTGKLTSGRTPSLTRGLAQEVDQIICGLNQTRWDLTTMVRDIRGYGGSVLPQKGEPIIFRANGQNNGMAVFNGQQATVLHCSAPYEDGDKGLGILDLVVELETGTQAAVQVSTLGFEAVYALLPDGLNTKETKDQRSARESRASFYARSEGILYATWAHVITGHACQGSEYNQVAVMDESAFFRNDRAQWLYTAVTRASQHTTVVTRPVTNLGRKADKFRAGVEPMWGSGPKPRRHVYKNLFLEVQR